MLKPQVEKGKRGARETSNAMTGTNIAMTGTIAGNLATRRLNTCESLEGTLLNILHGGKLQHRAAAIDSSSSKLFANSTPHHYSFVPAQLVGSNTSQSQICESFVQTYDELVMFSASSVGFFEAMEISM